jgi:ribosome biogenesis protein BRX1
MASLFKAVSNDSMPSQKEPDGAKKNKQRVLILTSRGVTYRHRHLLNDIVSMMPHGRKESKWESKKKLQELNEIAELLNCNSILFFEARKRQDLYLWLSRAPNGPCVKFHLHNCEALCYP